MLKLTFQLKNQLDNNGDESAARILRRLGLGVREIDWELATKLDLQVPGGVCVIRTEPGGTAAKVGLKWGDIILQVDNIDITAFRDIEKAISSHISGTPVRFLVRRSGTIRFLVCRFD
jgi:serine protease Do